MRATLGSSSGEKDSSSNNGFRRYEVITQPSQADGLFPLPGKSGQPDSTFLSPDFQDSYIFPWNPDPLSQSNSYRIYDEMRHDDQIKVVLSLKKDMVINSGWKIDCEDTKVREYLDRNLSSGMDRSLDDVMRDMLSSYDYGFSISEPVYEIADSLYRWKTIHTRPPHGFRFNLDRYGRIDTIVQNTDRGDLSFKTNDFIHHVYQHEFGNPYGRSDLRSAHPAYIGKKFIFRFMNIYLEKFASPLVVGKYKDTLPDPEATRLHSMLKTIQNSTTITIPDSMILEIVQTERDGTDAYVKAINLCNMMIARSILVPDLMGVGGDKTGGGSYSLGQTQFKLFLSTVEKDKKSLARLITMRLIRPMVEANWGDIPATFEFLPFSQQDELEFARVWSDAVKGRVFTPNEDEINHFRAQLRFPQGEVVLPKDPIQVQDVNQEPDDDPSPPHKPDMEDEDEMEERSREKKMVRLHRDLTVYERNKRIDFKDISSVLESSETSGISKLSSAGKKIYTDFISQIIERGVISNFNPEAMETIQPRFMREMNEVFRQHFIGLFRRSFKQAQKEMFPFAAKKHQDEDAWLPEEFERFLQAESFKAVGDYSKEVIKKASNVLSRGIRDGLPQSEIVKLMKEVAGDMTETWITTVVRTRTTEVYNQARKSFWESDPIASELIEAYQFSAIIDERTSEVCESLDGKIFEKGDFIDRITPPLHFNCRSLLVPITRFEDYEPSKQPSIDSLIDKGGGLIAG